MSETADADTRIGQTIDGKYRLDTRLGQGGMGTVYRATHLRLRKSYAVKVIKAELGTSPDVVRRFELEGRAASKLNHPNITPVFDLGQTADGMLYLVMELVDGSSLKEVLAAGGPFAPARIVRLIRQVTSALAAAHDGGIVHRDLKPDNIMLTRSAGGQESIRLLDFGIAKTFDDGTGTLTGSVLGTPRYMSPEQSAGRPVDKRSDLYALGIILYEMLIGAVPFDGASMAEIMAKQINELPVPPSRRRPDIVVPPALEAVVLRCLQKDPVQRFQSAGELEAALDGLEDGAKTVPLDRAPDNSGGGRTRTPPRFRLAAGLVAALALAGGVLAGVYLWRGGSADTTSKGSTSFDGQGNETGPRAAPGMKVIPAQPGSGGPQDGAASFQMAINEVTNAEFARFLAAHPEWQRDAVKPPRQDGDYLKLWTTAGGPPGQDMHPVVFVTWDAAAAYCQAQGARLPTEAEWEYAGRAGSTTAYWWGETFDARRANARSTGTTTVGQADHVNDLGLADMAGNVWEWTASKEGDDRVVRGGSWRDAPQFLTSTSRQLIAPATTGPDLGFRCAR